MYVSLIRGWPSARREGSSALASSLSLTSGAPTEAHRPQVLMTEESDLDVVMAMLLAGRRPKNLLTRQDGSLWKSCAASAQGELARPSVVSPGHTHLHQNGDTSHGSDQAQGS